MENENNDGNIEYSYNENKKETASQNKTVLIMDSDETSRIFLNKKLKNDGYEIIEVNSLEEINSLVVKLNNILIIVLEIKSTIQNKNEFIKLGSYIDNKCSVPIAVVTREESKDNKVWFLTHGASYCFKKSDNLFVTYYRIKNMINICKNSDYIHDNQIDKLTGLYLRDYFFKRVEKELKENSNQEYDLIYMEIDDFEAIKISYGYKKANDLLNYIAMCIEYYGGKNGICGTLGENKFAILKKGYELRKQSKLYNDWEKCRDSEDFYRPIHNFNYKCGIYRIGENKNLSAEEMCDLAKIAGDTIKGQFGKFYAIYDISMKDDIKNRYNLIESMMNGLKNNEFVVYYQTKHSTKDKQVKGAEALVRWKKSDTEIISPNEFISFFEKNGFITNIDLFVLEEVCKTIKKRIDENKDNIPISVNLSRIDFTNQDLLDKIVEIVEKYQISHNLIHFEITETAYCQNNNIINYIYKLQKNGFQIEMDDFGSGYSSLSELIKCPIDFIKLDMKFINSDSNKSKKILEFVISLAKTLNISTIAEGVETKKQFDLLKEIGCDYMQGYYFSKPTERLLI